MDPRFKGRLEVGVAETWERLEKAIDTAATAAQVFCSMFVRQCINCSTFFICTVSMTCFMVTLFVSTASKRG